MIKPRSEAGRSTGTVKRKGSLAKMTNFGYYLDDDKAFISRCEEALAKAEVSEDLANKIAAAKEALEKEMAIEPVDMRSALNRLHSPLAKDDAEKEKIFKDSRSAVFLVRKAIYDTKLDGMVNTLTSKYASNAKRVLEDGIHTIEVTKGEMEKYGLTGDDITAGLYSATTLSQSTKSKAVAEFIVKMRPQLEKAIDAVKAADAINSSDLNAILLEMKDMFDAAQKDAEEIKYSVRTTIAAADKEDLDAIPQPDTLGESIQNEGIFSKLAGWFSNVVSKIRGFVDSILGLTEEANDEVDSLMALLEGVEESNKGEARNSGWSEEDSEMFAADLDPDVKLSEIKAMLKEEPYFIDNPHEIKEVAAEIFDYVQQGADESNKGEARNSGWSEEDSEMFAADLDPDVKLSEIKAMLKEEPYFEEHPHEIKEVAAEIFDYVQQGADESNKGESNPAKTESKGIEQVRKELNDIADLWVGNDYGDDKERALADACTVVEGTEWEDAACAILKDSDMMGRLTVAEAIELILSELPEA